MAKRRRTKKPKAEESTIYRCICGECGDPHAHLPAYLLIAFGLMTLPINFGLIGGLEFAKAWPLLLVMIGFVLLVKVQLCRLKGK
jgi:hypothetical protein